MNLPETNASIAGKVEEQLCSMLVKYALIAGTPERLSGESPAHEVRISQIADEYIKTRGLTNSQTAAEQEYVPWEVVDAVIKHYPTLEWKLIFALARTIPTRIRSEIEELAWGDVD